MMMHEEECKIGMVFCDNMEIEWFDRVITPLDDNIPIYEIMKEVNLYQILPSNTASLLEA